MREHNFVVNDHSVVFDRANRIRHFLVIFELGRREFDVVRLP